MVPGHRQSNCFQAFFTHCTKWGFRQDLKQSTEVVLWIFIGSFYHNQCATEPGTLGQVQQKVGKGGQAVKGSENGGSLCLMQLGGMSQWRDAWKGVMQAKPTGVLNKDEKDVVVEIIRPQDDENLEKVSYVPQGRLNCGDTMQKKVQDLLVLWM